MGVCLWVYMKETDSHLQSRQVAEQGKVLTVSLYYEVTQQGRAGGSLESMHYLTTLCAGKTFHMYTRFVMCCDVKVYV